MFERNATMDDAAAMACRGCAAKLPAPMEGLQQADRQPRLSGESGGAAVH